MAKAPHKKHSAVPSKEELLAFIASQPGKVGTREIARAFNLKNDRRAELKRLLRDLADEGQVASRRRKLHKPGTLPSITEGDITGRDSDGELIAVPTEWDEAEHGAPPTIRIRTPRQPRPGETAGIGDRAVLRVEPSSEDDNAYNGRIIRVIERAAPRVIGVFRELPSGGARLVPVDKKQLGKEMAIAASQTKGAKDGDLIAASVIRTGRFGLPVAQVEELLGSLKSERAVSLIAIHAHGIPHTFPIAVQAEADTAKPATLEDGREDWRKLPLVTIDPADAKDHDDAVHAAIDPDPDNPGGFILTVAIADVAHYVRPGSALDREALHRGNSVYFPDRVVPMLPERISNDLCSLRPNEDRAALAVRMIIAADGRKKSHTFHRVLMRSAAKLSYQQAQAAVGGTPDDVTGPLLDNILKPLYAAYDALKRARDARGPLDLDLPERKIVLKHDGTIDRVITPERLESHRLIEEFMILANVAAAETLEHARVPQIYRVHDEPSVEKIEGLRKFLESLHISFSKGGALRAEQFNRILDRVKGQDVEKLINEVVLRSQSQAEYSAQNYGHFGLNLRRYSHFTSPIRRYPDLIVHRALIAAYGLGDGGLSEADKGRFAEFGEHLSMCERRAVMAERGAMDRYVAAYMAAHVGATFPGRVTSVTRFGLFVSLDGTGADGLVPIRDLGQEFFRHDEGRQLLIGERTGENYGLGDKVRVKLLEADAATGGLLFDLVDVVERVERVALPRRRPGREAAGPRRHVAHRKGPRDKRSRRRK